MRKLKGEKIRCISSKRIELKNLEEIHKNDTERGQDYT